jgi:hypothetical protein
VKALRKESAGKWRITQFSSIVKAQHSRFVYSVKSVAHNWLSAIRFSLSLGDEHSCEMKMLEVSVAARLSERHRFAASENVDERQ